MNQNICLRCGHIFNNKSNLNRHYQKTMTCPNTYYNYTSQYMYKNHIKLKAMRIELIVYINKPSTSIKFKMKSESPSQIIYKQLKHKLTQLDNTNNTTNTNTTNTNTTNEYEHQKEYKCICGKIFNHHSSLSRHKKTKHKKTETLLSKLLKNRKN